MRRRRWQPLGAPKIAWRWIGLGAAVLLVGRERRRVRLPPVVTTTLVAPAPLFVAAGLSPGKVRRAAVWGAQMWAYKIAFEAPHDRRERHRSRVRVDYPIRLDSILGRGKPFGQRLQSRLRNPPQISALDRAMAAIYAFWDAEPHLVLAYLLVRHPQRFTQAAARLAAVYDLTLVGYWAIPTAPPWWASEKLGRMDGEVRRVVVEVKREAMNQDRPVADHEVGANPWAAMPSDHFATSIMAAWILSGLGPRAGVAGWLYALSLGFALIYLGEHYLTDLLAGAALAAVVGWGGQAATEPVRTLASIWPRAT
jgi:membrane-associated phospholipid phosphatase